MEPEVSLLTLSPNSFAPLLCTALVPCTLHFLRNDVAEALRDTPWASMEPLPFPESLAMCRDTSGILLYAPYPAGSHAAPSSAALLGPGARSAVCTTPHVWMRY